MSRATAALLLGFAILVSAACDKVPLTAPTQSRITLTVSTSTVPVNGTAEVTAMVIEQAGTPVQNGTLVTFTMSGTPTTAPSGNTSSLAPTSVVPPRGNGTSSDRNGTFDTPGAIGTFDPPDAPTHNGRAVTKFRAGAFSGTINIGAVSGGATATSIAINVGGAAAGQVVLRADPSSVPVTGGTSQITAVVIDASGNALPGAPVVFSADNGTLSSNSAVTDTNGEARVSLTTNRDTTVRATVGAKSGTVTVRAVTLPSVQITISGTTTPEANVATNFTVTANAASTGNPIRSVVIDFGDGTTPLNLGTISGTVTVSHTFRAPGTYTVSATATDTQGVQSETRTVVTVNPTSPLPVTLTASPNPVSLSPPQFGLVDFTASVTAAATGLTYFWNFGDGTGYITTGGSTNHRYGTQNTYTASVTVVDSNGREGFSTRTIRVNQ